MQLAILCTDILKGSLTGHYGDSIRALGFRVEGSTVIKIGASRGAIRVLKGSATEQVMF